MTWRRDDAHRIWIGGVSVAELVETFGTPLYVMDYATVVDRLGRYQAALAACDPPGLPYYAGKAFLCRALAGLLEERGVGLDVVSGGELATALAGGFDPRRILFHGNVKTRDEIAYGLAQGVGLWAVDSLDELALLDQMAGAAGVKAAIVLRLTPGIEAHTHAFIRTGQFDTKFGLAMAAGIAEGAVDAALAAPHLDLVGYHAHIGSQILEVEPFLANLERLLGFARDQYQRLGFWPEVLDVGGGLGVRYTPEDDPPPLEVVVEGMRELLRQWTPPDRSPPRLYMEPGRSVVAEAGVTLYRVGAIKTVPSGRRYLAVDGGMGDNIRPALYQAPYRAEVDGKVGEAVAATLAGRYCESGDILIAEQQWPADVAVGDVVAVLGTGAYNYTMASNYNRVPRPPVVAVREGQARVWVEGERWEDLYRLDRPWEPW
ncbi:MAG: diaminopimelate decarboxylase [Firmicutes bacterium]|nr:diaminopimelate decarboxylase [Alicyclobacillaceae bacterium]MCL6496712.1 diaminopimelate decarboxylase [Bacillota bacterium]